MATPVPPESERTNQQYSYPPRDAMTDAPLSDRKISDCRSQDEPQGNDSKVYNTKSYEIEADFCPCSDDAENVSDILVFNKLQTYDQVEPDFHAVTQLRQMPERKKPSPAESKPVNMTEDTINNMPDHEFCSGDQCGYISAQAFDLIQKVNDKVLKRAYVGCPDSDANTNPFKQAVDGMPFSPNTKNRYDISATTKETSLVTEIASKEIAAFQQAYGVIFYRNVCCIWVSSHNVWHENRKYKQDHESQARKQTTKIVFYVIKKGKKHAKCSKIYTIITEFARNPQAVFERCLEEKFTEVPQFVDVTQPGRVSDIASDPPGQQSSYIRPGDNRSEAYRLSTFENFPHSAPVNIADLAKQGFSYTGFDDCVKCYSCGRTTDKWQRGDSPTDRRWHKPDCPFSLGQPADNVPIGGIFNQRFGAPRLTDSALQNAGYPNFSRQVVNFSRDVGDRLSTGDSYHMQPGSDLYIGANVPLRPAESLTSRLGASGRELPRQWRMASVISADHRRYLNNLYLNRELDRLASFSRWPTSRPNVGPVSLARAGFFYLGDMDRTQCFSCAIVLRNWTLDDNAMEQHQMHCPNCPLVLRADFRNVRVPEQQETPQELSVAYPCRYPTNPHMRSEAARVETFDRRWPMNRTRASVAEIADAGFFFLGERDRVKCWYCNGGLQNWEYEDTPWIEHAKWFPSCQFLLRRQGQLFVYRHLSLAPHLPRPIIGRQEGSTIDPVGFEDTPRGYDIPPVTSGARARPPSPPPTIIDPQEEMRKRKERVEKEMKENSNVKIVIQMGYEDRVVYKVLEEQLESGSAADDENIFDDMISLLDAVQRREAEIQKELEEEKATSIKLLQQPVDIFTPPSNWNVAEISSMETGMPSSVACQASAPVDVSGFNSEDEDMDLYSSVMEGAVGGANAHVAATEASTSHSSINIPKDPKSIMEMLQQKQDERLCKICFTEQADMVFIPCSHMCCCKTCTEAIRQCPLCRIKIEKAIKTYLK